MCKLFIMSNASKLDPEVDIETIADNLLAVERDGFGYAIQGHLGVFGEKSADDQFITQLYDSFPRPQSEVRLFQSSFGKVSRITGAAIFHGRTSTNKSGIKNTHPMQKSGWHLIHNGVVSNQGAPYKKLTDNDSEDVLHYLINGGIDAIADNLSGYYAFGAIGPDGTLHVARDYSATLHIAWSASHDTWVFCTTKNLMNKIAGQIGMKLKHFGEMKRDYYFTMKGNKILSEKDFESLGYSKTEAAFASKSLGKNLPAAESYADDTNPNRLSAWDNYESVSSLADLWNEIYDLDETYAIWDGNGREISVTQFTKLNILQRLACEIVREDGTTLDTEALEDDYYSYNKLEGVD